MINGLFNDKTYQALYGSLSGLTTRQNVIGNNIANVDTPNFIASDVTFEEALQAAVSSNDTNNNGSRFALTTTNPGHISLGSEYQNQTQAEIASQPGGAMRNDGNNVDIEREMSMLADTEIRYNTLTQLAATKYSGLKSIIRDTR